MQRLLFVILVLMLVGCGAPDASPSATYTLGEIIYSNSFDDPSSWERFGAGDTQFGISDGVYNAISTGGGYIPVTNNHVHGNAVIEATIELRAGSDDVIYGITCRSQAPNPNIAYYFLLNGAGEYGIRIGDGSRIRVAVPWSEHPAIHEGLATNTMRIVCIDDYLALYINDRFVAETNDAWLSEGLMALVVSAPTGTAIVSQFDDVTIWDASLSSP